MDTLGSYSQRLGRQLPLQSRDVEWLDALVADWQLLADLSFADLVLWFPHTAQGVVSAMGRSFIALAQTRPSTAPTTIHRDVVGDRIRADLKPMVERAWHHQVETNSSDQGQPSPARNRVVAMPLVRTRHNGQRQSVGVITMHYEVTPLRSPTAQEIAFMRCANDMFVMVSAGVWPDPAHDFSGYAGAPRVGDGLLRLDVNGTITFASPNAVSAFLRLGVHESLEGRSLPEIGAELQRATSVVAHEPQPMLTGRRPMRAELEAHGAAVSLRAIPLHAAAKGSVVNERFAALVLCRDVTELRRKEKQLMSKDATIKEIHHRVKNNLQTVSALLRMQSRRMVSDEGRSGLEQAMRRVETIALVHDSLSQGLDETVDVDELMQRQLHLAAEMANSQHVVHTELLGSFGHIPTAMVTPLALVVTELVANAVEHGGAAVQDSPLEVVMTVRRHRNAAGRERLELQVKDNGVGLPPEGWEPGLGLRIVRTLVRGELDGSISWEPAAQGVGAQVSLQAPILV